MAGSKSKKMKRAADRELTPLPNGRGTVSVPHQYRMRQQAAILHQYRARQQAAIFSTESNFFKV
jgi:hypothetical protein